MFSKLIVSTDGSESVAPPETTICVASTLRSKGITIDVEMPNRPEVALVSAGIANMLVESIVILVDVIVARTGAITVPPTVASILE